MPRLPREVSDTGIYHAILRGVNKQQIFECSKDYEHFIKILQRVCGIAPSLGTPIDYSEKDLICAENPVRHCHIYAWCLMSNHVHLLIKPTNETIGEVMKRITSAYAYFYNRKYDRVGHLFQERFTSQPVADWDYFQTLLRYIHQNPVKGHKVNDINEYRWSSWMEFMGLLDFQITSKKAVTDRISHDDLVRLMNETLSDNEDARFLDFEVRKERRQLVKDEDSWQLLKEISGASNMAEFQALDRPLQKHYIYLAHEQGIGPRTLSRLTGVSYCVVTRATSAAKDKYHYPSQCVRDASPDDTLFLSYCDPEDFLPNPSY